MKTSKLVGIAAALLVAVAASLVFVLGSRTGDGAGGPGAWTDVSPERLAAMLAEDDPFVVNVHVPYEGEIPGTDAFIPYDEIGARMSELPSDRGADIVLYCRSGRMSTEAARALAAEGYTSVYNLAGGFEAWEAAGYELLRREGVPGA